MENLLLLGLTTCMALLSRPSAMLAVSLAHPPLNGFSRLNVRDTDPKKLAFFPAADAGTSDADDDLDPLPLLCCCIPDTYARILASSDLSASFSLASDASARACARAFPAADCDSHPPPSAPSPPSALRSLSWS